MMRVSELPNPAVISQLFPCLQILDIDNERCDCQAVELIKDNPNLTSVSVAFSSKYHTGASALADVIQQHKNLTSVSILNSSASAEDFNAISRAVSTEKVTGVLVITGDGCALDVDAPYRMAAAIKKNKRLTEVTLQHLGIENPEWVDTLAEAIAQHDSLTFLDLASNYFYDGGAFCIADALQKNRRLTKINLCGGYITDAGAVPLANAFKKNKTLTKVDLGNNEIGDAGATTIADAIKQNSTLTYLSMSDNQIGPFGACAIAKSINENTRICVDIRGNPISNEEISKIAAGFDAAVVSTDAHPYFENLSNSSVRLFLPPIDEANEASFD